MDFLPFCVRSVFGSHPKDFLLWRQTESVFTQRLWIVMQKIISLMIVGLVRLETSRWTYGFFRLIFGCIFDKLVFWSLPSKSQVILSGLIGKSFLLLILRTSCHFIDNLHSFLLIHLSL